MKRGVSPSGNESFSFGTENRLRIFPPNTYKFKPKDHVTLDEIQECILDNFWFNIIIREMIEVICWQY